MANAGSTLLISRSTEFGRINNKITSDRNESKPIKRAILYRASSQFGNALRRRLRRRFTPPHYSVTCQLSRDQYVGPSVPYRFSRLIFVSALARLGRKWCLSIHFCGGLSTRPVRLRRTA